MAELPPSDIGADEARRLADDVLAGRAYVEADRPPSLRDRVFNWIGARLGDLFESLSSAGGRGLFAWVIIVGFAALIIFLLVKLLRNTGQLPTATPSTEPIIEAHGDRSSTEWIAAAETAEAAGDWRLAVRCRHQALVTHLISAGVVTSRPSQTAGEIQILVTQQVPACAEAMREATWLFKDTWYGWVDADAASSTRFAELSAQVLRLSDDHMSTPQELVPT